MRFERHTKAMISLLLGCVFVFAGGCASTPPKPAEPVKPPAPVYATIDMQKLIEQHPSRTKLRQMEQALEAAQAAEADQSAAIDTARREFEAAMKVRQNEDNAALAKRQEQLGEELTKLRQQYIESLEAEYRPLLFNIDLKLKTLQSSPTEKQAAQKDKDRLEAEMKQKLSVRETQLQERFNKEMEQYAAELSRQSEEYAKKWTDERMQRLKQESVSPEREKQRQQIVELSARMIQDIRTAAAKVAGQEKIEMVLVRQAVRSSAKDITEAVAKEIANAK